MHTSKSELAFIVTQRVKLVTRKLNLDSLMARLKAIRIDAANVMLDGYSVNRTAYFSLAILSWSLLIVSLSGVEYTQKPTRAALDSYHVAGIDAINSGDSVLTSYASTMDWVESIVLSGYRKAVKEISHYQTACVPDAVLTEEDYLDSESVAVESEHQDAVRHRVVSFEIQRGFRADAVSAGITEREQRALERIIGWRLSLSRLGKGDSIQLLIRDGSDEVDANRMISAVKISYNGQQISAFGYRDHKGGWSYYDQNGNPFRENVFSRIPLEREFRVSSHFAPNRLHPITRRHTAHRGTDFATPVGTRVVMPADGVVARGGRNHLNGNYLMIDHPGGIRTVYLHLHQIHPQLKIGMRVRKGDIVALTGNTGRSTGPHLHYEVHDMGKPVDAMRARLPNDAPLAEQDLANFRAYQDEIIARLNVLEEGSLVGNMSIMSTESL